MGATGTGWSGEATVDRGDHGMGHRRVDPARVGWVDAGATLRWAPASGLGWELPVAELTVTGPPRWPAGRDGVEVRHPEAGTLRIRPMRGARHARMLARALIAGGARSS